MAGDEDKVKIYRTKQEKKKYGKNHPMDVVICFDTTGSMSRFLVEVREDIAKTMRKIFSEMKNVKVAVSVRVYILISINFRATHNI